MATVTPTTNNAFLDQQLHTWAGLSTTNTTGIEVSNAGGYHSCSVQITGTLGAGGTLVIEGSNDEQNWFTLANAANNAALSITAPGLYMVWEATLWIRPRVAGGDGTTSLNVAMVKNRARPR